MPRNHQGYRDRADAIAEDYEANDRRHRGNSGRRGKGHPPGLTGKQIGLYYRDQGRKKKTEHGGKHSKSPQKGKRTTVQDYPYFSLDRTTEQMVESLLMELKSPKAEHSSMSYNNIKNDDFEKQYLHVQESHFKRKFLDIISGSIQESFARSMCMNSKLVSNKSLNIQLKEELEAKKNQEKYKKMLEVRSKLPSFNMKDEILEVTNENQVVVISGETGCGKTTQVAQFILDDAIEKEKGSTTKIVCTQPRRISAISVAERVAAERGENLGVSVGYQIRLEKHLCRDYGSILFCTTGLLLQFMQSDPALRDYSHIILDEIHERNTDSDFIITLLKQVILKRPDLKIILMSATLNADRFSKYYDDCPTIHIPGFTYPVTEYYLEDVIKFTKYRSKPSKKMKSPKSEDEKNFYEGILEPALRKMSSKGTYPARVINELRNPNIEDLNLELIQLLIEYICTTKKPGAILVFLPGYQDISHLDKNLGSSGQFPSSKYRIYPLHSRLPTVQQKAVFDPPPQSVRKIIISTSIAETSITIEDVVYVIDCGRTKLSRFDVNRNLETLNPEWTSLANAKQRRGRAGRVQPGECYRLYTKARELVLDAYPTPEMLRTPLEQVILRLKILQLGRTDIFLGSVLDPPEHNAIEVSLELLRGLNAIDDTENLTPLGYHLAQLPLDPRTGKMLLLASMFSCAEPVFAIAASLAFKDAFYCPMGREEEANKAKLDLGLGQFSDHIALAEALRRFEKAFATREAGYFCSRNFLSWNTLKLLSEMKYQFAQCLHEMKFLENDNLHDARANRNSCNLSLVKAIVCAGLFPNIAILVKKLPKFPLLKTIEDGTVKIHPRSINAKAQQLPTSYVTYFQKQKSTAIYLHDTTCVNEAAVIFAASKCSIKPKEKRSLIVINSGLSFLCKQRTGEIITKLQDEFNKLLEHKFSHPGTIKWDSREGCVLRAAIEFVSEGCGEMYINNMNVYSDDDDELDDI